MISEAVLILTIGFSPGSANHTSLKVLEYVQPSMKICKQEQEKINKATQYTYSSRSYPFRVYVICVQRQPKANK